jgi:hypothetical protein
MKKVTSEKNSNAAKENKVITPTELIWVLGIVAVIFGLVYAYVTVFMDPKKREEFFKQQDDLLKNYGSEHEIRNRP